MTHLASLCRVALVSVTALALASACGGSSFTNGGDGGDSGSNNGGSQSQAGNHNSAGKPSAGSSSAGSGSSGGGPAGGTGSGGSSPGGEACSAPAVTGNCEAYFERWFHDATTGLCRPFVYGGCGGNENNYETFEACQNACPSGSPNYDACTAPSDCVITGAGCCGACDAPDLTARDLIAYNGKHQADFTLCTGAGACAPCPEPTPGQGSLVYFVPDCVQGQCAVQDIRTSAVTACRTPDECRLRNGPGCCEGCVGNGNVIAVRSDGSFEKLVCGDEPVACPACEPQAPLDAIAVCTEGRCQVAYVATTD